MVFNRDPGAALYWSAGAPVSRPFGFLPALLNGPSATLETTWLDAAGVYFALTTALPPGMAPLLELALREWLVIQGWPEAGQRMLWVDGHAEGIRSIRIQALAVARLPTGAPLAGRTTFDLNGYLLELPAGAMLDTTPDGIGLQVTGPSAFCVAHGPPMAYPVVDGRVTMPASGDHAGALQFAIDLVNNGQPRDDFVLLDVGVRYGWRVGEVGVDYLQIDVLRQPVAAPLRLWGTISPFAPLDPAATRFSFVGAAPNVAPRLPSRYFEPETGALTLTPVTSDGVRPGGLVFAAQPLLYDVGGGAPVRFYLTPDGGYRIDAGDILGDLPLAPPRVACGVAALEYIRADGFPGMIAFTPGAAFFDPALPGTDGTTLTLRATTAWVSAPADWGYAYFTQPDASPFFGDTDDSSYLGFVEMPAATLPAGSGAMPMLGYADLDAATAQAALALEGRIVAPNRKAALRAIGTAPIGTPPATLGLTPLGVAAGFGATDANPWAWLGLASLAGGARPDIAFDQIGPPFRDAMLSGRGFLAMANPHVVLGQSTIAYELDQKQVDALKNDPPQCFAPADLDRLPPAGVLYPTEAAFLAAIPFGNADPRTDVLLRLGGQMRAQIEDWTFQLSPRSWPPVPADEVFVGLGKTAQTVMILKLDRKQTLIEWLDAPHNWAWPEAGTLDGPQSVSQIVHQAIALARQRYAAARDPASSPYRHLLFEVLVDPDWAGLIVFNCAVPVDSMPAGLDALSAGMNLSNFYAHHIGFDASLVHVDADGTPHFEPGSAFGAIDYEDETDLVASTGTDFGFKTLQLTLGFASSRVTSFVGQAELLIDTLFSATARKYPTDRGNNIVLDGVRLLQMSTDGAKYIYRFSSAAHSTYRLAGSALQSVLVDQVAMLPNAALSGAVGKVVDFQIVGGMQFWVPARQPPGGDSPGGFDLFSYGGPPPAPAPADPIDDGWRSPAVAEFVDTPFGPARVFGRATIASSPRAAVVEDVAVDPPIDDAGPASPGALAFAKLIVRMTYDGPGDVAPTFALVIEDVGFDPAGSRPRTDGLSSRFPAVPTRFIRVLGTTQPPAPPAGPTPADLGYITADCGLSQARLKPPWYGIEYDVSLGSLGALAGGAEIVLKLLAAWQVDADATDTPPIFLGVKLPGSGSDGFQLPLQGILQIGFGAMQFQTYELPAPSGRTPGLGYTLRLRDFALRVLGKSFPSGHIDVILAGSPDAASPTKLGWYAGYKAAEDPVAQRRVRPERRSLAVRAIRDATED